MCLSCGATEASQWRGPGGNYCSVGKCKTEAKEASKRMRNTAAPLAEQVTALKSARALGVVCHFHNHKTPEENALPESNWAQQYQTDRFGRLIST